MRECRILALILRFLSSSFRMREAFSISWDSKLGAMSTNCFLSLVTRRGAGVCRFFGIPISWAKPWKQQNYSFLTIILLMSVFWMLFMRKFLPERKIITLHNHSRANITESLKRDLYTFSFDTFHEIGCTLNIQSYSSKPQRKTMMTTNLDSRFEVFIPGSSLAPSRIESLRQPLRALTPSLDVEDIFHTFTQNLEKETTSIRRNKKLIS